MLKDRVTFARQKRHESSYHQCPLATPRLPALPVFMEEDVQELEVKKACIRAAHSCRIEIGH